MARTVYSAASITLTTSSATAAYVQKVGLDLPGSTFFLFASWEFTASSTASNHVARTRLESDLGLIGWSRQERLRLPYDSTTVGWHNGMGFRRVQSSGTYSITYLNSFAGDVLSIKNARITAIAVSTQDMYAEDTSTSAVSSTTYTTKMNMVISASSSGLYLVMANACFLASAPARARVTIDSTQMFGDHDMHNEEGLSRNGFVGACIAPVISSALVTLDHLSITSTPAVLDQMCLLALRLDQFTGSTFDSTFATQASTAISSSPSNSVSITPTLFPSTYVCLTFGAMNGSDNTQAIYSDYVDGGTTKDHFSYIPRDNNSNRYFGSACVTTSTGNFGYQFYQQSSATNTIDDVLIAILAVSDSTISSTSPYGTPVMEGAVFASGIFGNGIFLY